MSLSSPLLAPALTAVIAMSAPAPAGCRRTR